MNPIKIFLNNICPALEPGQSRPNIIRKKPQAHFCFRLFCLLKLIRECRTENEREPHNKLQLEIFSILLTLVFVFMFVFLLRCVAFLSPFFSFVFIVPIVRCHVLCCSAHVRSELFLLMRFFVSGFVVQLLAKVRCVSAFRRKFLEKSQFG